MPLTWETMLRYLTYHPRWFEGISRRRPDSTHVAEFRAVMPGSWGLRRHSYWFVAEPPGADEVGQGWKLHVSATSRTSVDTLRRSLPVLRDAGVRFKFLIDPAAMAELNGKSFSRSASGKFITVYPPDEESFHRVAGALTEALRGFDGPYVLSDRRYPGSRVVSYRYGGFARIVRLQPIGVPELLIQSPDGSLVPDERTPYWTVPAWATDPVTATHRGPAAAAPKAAAPAKAASSTAASSTAAPGTKRLLDGRYEVEGAIAFSNRGGIYHGIDTVTGADVVLREARPGVEIGPHGIDAVELLRHEHTLLTELADSGLFVRPLGFFTRWEHSFLVEEVVEGTHFGTLTTTQNPLYELDMTPGRLVDYYQRFQRLWLQLADAIAYAHERGIVLGDLSMTNVMVTPDDRVRIIDLESAFHEGVDHGAGLSTPGMVTRRALAARHGDRRTDYYALGAVMLATVFACQQNDIVEHDLPLRLLGEVAADLALPAELVSLITDLFAEDADLPEPAALRRRIADLPFATAWRQAPPLAHPVPAESTRSPDLHRRIAAVLDGVVAYMEGTADTTREDRLFPADALVFETNPLSLAHGAYGCLHAMHSLRQDVPDTLLAWALSRSTAHAAMPPGLYYGSAGVAWALSAMGHRDQAVNVLRGAAGHPLQYTEPGVLTGAAGHGMACLRLWRDSGLPEFLDRARETGEHLAATARWEDGRAYWPDSAGEVPVGYGNGASGVAMFLLALHAATGDGSTLALGRAALDFDLSCVVYSPSGLAQFPSYRPGDIPAVRRSYWDEGTAGVLTTLLRYWHVTGDDLLRKQVDRLLPDARHKYTAFPQLFHGISGIGNALLDAYEFLGDPELLGDAERAAEAVLCSAVRRPEGIVFPGEQTLRESCDLATGSAGVALFLDRVRHAAPGLRTNRNFVLDDLLPGPPSAVGGGS
ncbi:class III lanthionine synthetase LanKC [Actinacidiphila acididurans]|uniref:Class III lanthionine synthetase LanKC n=1 Tax=Actinacidiphila acididurans TaxID=2784346 RepID=A0ABS2U1H8_9ACTN|nr:class III lanthionine synthetase LanKC [Actinacidiphila acididurans]MBM9508897.1 class III lanthionine synthetase LanKC [Actinacidiphila acididurans]